MSRGRKSLFFSFCPDYILLLIYLSPSSHGNPCTDCLSPLLMVLPLKSGCYLVLGVSSSSLVGNQIKFLAVLV